MDKFLDLRNRNHADEFRFDVTPELWKTHYLFGDETESANNVLKIVDNGTLMGYAVYSTGTAKGAKTCRILDICAKEKEVFAKLVNRLVERCIGEDVDFIYFKQAKEKFSDVLRKKGFFTARESVIMVVLLNPVELFSSISEEVKQGKILKLMLTGSSPIALKVGENGVQVVADQMPDLTISTDSKTFLQLLFGKTSILKEILKQKVTMSSIFGLPTAKHFFDLIRQEGWYIPSGDWL